MKNKIKKRLYGVISLLVCMLMVVMNIHIVQVHAAEKSVELARKRLQAVMVERKSHEKLREKAFEQFKQELAVEEAKEIDQLVSFTYHDHTEET